MNIEYVEALLDAKDTLVRAEKNRAMLYQADLKDRIAAALKCERQELYNLPYEEWALIRGAYLAAGTAMLMRQNPLTNDWLCWIPGTGQAYYDTNKLGAKQLCAQANADLASGKVSVVDGKLVIPEPANEEGKS